MPNDLTTAGFTTTSAELITFYETKSVSMTKKWEFGKNFAVERCRTPAMQPLRPLDPPDGGKLEKIRDLEQKAEKEKHVDDEEKRLHEMQQLRRPCCALETKLRRVQHIDSTIPTYCLYQSSHLFVESNLAQCRGILVVESRMKGEKESRAPHGIF